MTTMIRRVDLRACAWTLLLSHITIAAWLSAFAKPGQVTAAVWEDPPLFASEANPAVGQWFGRHVPAD
jgi:hypothetical protein